jgi:hypothetical protein
MSKIETMNEAIQKLKTIPKGDSISIGDRVFVSLKTINKDEYIVYKKNKIVNGISTWSFIRKHKIKLKKTFDKKDYYYV